MTAAIFYLFFKGKLNQGKVLSAEELKKKQDAREDELTPKTFYKIQPEKQGRFFKFKQSFNDIYLSLGKIIWLSGPPGAGKSTSGLMLARLHNYVYYEADSFMFSCNPYIPLDVSEPSLANFSQEPLKVRN